MNGTPRLRSAFPATPQTTSRAPRTSIPPQHGTSKRKLPSAQFDNAPASPVIPLDTIDAATQRTFAAGFWAVLWAWKLADFWSLYKSDDPESLWLFMKWILIDGIFLFGLPTLRIPWLEWSSTVMTFNFLVHAVFDAMLMFQIGLPIGAWIHWAVKLFYDRELAVSERLVKAQQVVDPASLIQGKHIINILPEGSAILNPHDEVFCIGGDIHHVSLPIQINQTQPVLIELLRRDFTGEATETLTIKAKEAKNLRSAAHDLHKRTKGTPKSTDPLVLRYQVKKPGQYTIRKVVDESNLQVKPRSSEVLVVACPLAKIVTDTINRCRGDLSDVAFEVKGTPPLKMKYRKLLNGNPTEASFQSIQPPDFVSPYARQEQLTVGRANSLDISWAGAKKVIVPINETMIGLGKYNYFIDDIEDALGNRVVYYNPRQLDGGEVNPKHPEVSRMLTVHDRPSIWIPTGAGCNSEKPLKVAEGKEVNLPHKIASAGQTEYDIALHNDYSFNEDHTIEYEFYPESSLQSGKGRPIDGASGSRRTLRKRRPSDEITLKEPGLYVLTDISTNYCRGEVSELSSCLLQNPIKPSVKISSTEITHRCANSPIGLEVNFDFEGTPPFTIRYVEERIGDRSSQLKAQKFDGHRGRLEIRQQNAGHYKYTFKAVSDYYYEGQTVGTVLQQDVKPSASAFIDEQSSSLQKNLCLGSSASLTVRLVGEAPWTLEYEIIHGKNRRKLVASDLTNPIHEIQLPEATEGGEYTVSLTSVTDASGCKEFLKEESKFHVWSQEPIASFGKVNDKYSASILEGHSINLPLKFTGQAPFVFEIGKVNDGAVVETQTYRSSSAATVHAVKHPGTYVLIDTRDNYCPGVIDQSGSRFVVDWVARPVLSLAEHPTIEQKGNLYTKADICEGDEDSVKLLLQGSAPFDVKYDEHARPDEGQKSLRKEHLKAPFSTASIKLNTARAGNFEYKFQDVSDANYDADPRRKDLITLQQHVLQRPAGRFANPGNTYSFCSTEGSADEAIPIKFTGTPPFSVDIDVQHSGSASPESMTLSDLQTNTHDLRVPRNYLRSGQSHLTIRRVRDGRGCQSKVNTAVTPSRIYISVHDPPSIVALETRKDFCVGERVSYRLTGVPPFTIFYTFGGEKRKASEKTTTFTRFNALPGEFVITGIADSSSKCQFSTSLHKTIHAMPGVKMSNGRETAISIHEGDESDVIFELTGEPPFELTYTRSEYAKKGRKGVVLETKTERTEEQVLRVKESEGGEYEPVSVRDRWCLTSKAGAQGRKGQKLLMQ